MGGINKSPIVRMNSAIPVSPLANPAMETREKKSPNDQRIKLKRIFIGK